MSFTHTTAEAASALRTSVKTLMAWRKAGAFRAGVHFRAIGTGKVKPRLIWDLTATEAALARRSKALGS